MYVTDYNTAQHSSDIFPLMLLTIFTG